MEKQHEPFSIRRQAASFKPAINGLVRMWKAGHNYRIHLTIAVMTILLGILFRISRVEWIGVVLCFGLVISTEIMNTAVEELVDFISPEHHAIAGRIKDLAAAAVLVSAGVAGIVGLIIFLPYLAKLLPPTWQI